MLKPQEAPWPGIQKVTLEVRDQQGQACPDQQVLTVTVCTCDHSATCNSRAATKSSKLGPAAIGLLLLGLLMLLREHMFISVPSLLTGLFFNWKVTPSILQLKSP